MQIHLLSALVLGVGRSIGGIAAGVFIATLEDCETAEWRNVADLPADAERTECVL